MPGAPTGIGSGAGVAVPATSGVASSLVLSPRPNRKQVIFTNDSVNVIYLSKYDPATLNAGIRLNPNGGSYSEPGFTGEVWAGQWYAISTVAGSNLCIQEDF